MSYFKEETDRRVQIATHLWNEGKTYAEIAEVLGLKSRGTVNYYLHIDKRRRTQRVNYMNNVAERRAYMRAYRKSHDGIAVAGDRTAFKRETKYQAALWTKLLSEARP